MPSALPPEHHRLRGTAPRRDQHVGFTPVDRIGGEPEPPSWLDKESLAVWSHVCLILRHRGELGLDLYWALLPLVGAIVDCQRLKRQIQASGITQNVEMKRGGKLARLHPAAQLLQERKSDLLKWLRQFGLTPRSIIVD